MKKHTSHSKTYLAAAFMAAFLATSAVAKENQLSLSRAIPNDVFLYIGTTDNPEQEFLREYWADVFNALKQCGIGDDVLKLVSSAVGEEGMAEVTRLKELATKLIDNIDFDNLANREFVYAQRMSPVVVHEHGINMGPPDMVWLFRCSEAGAKKNFQAFADILDAIIGEINKAAEEEVLRAQKSDTPQVHVNLAEKAGKGVPPMRLSLALHEDVIVLTFGDKVFEQVMNLLAGKNAGESLNASSRFQNAFKDLPPAEDSLVFFDLQKMMVPIENLINIVMNENTADQPDDVVFNASNSGEAYDLCTKAWKVYEEKDFKQGLELTSKAYELAPEDSAVLYYMACFKNLNGDKTAALDFLEKAVDHGFYKPKHISWDPDLKSLHEEARYQAAVDKAAEMAAQHGGNDIKAWKQLVARLLDVPMIVDYIATVEYTEGHSVTSETKTALVPGAKDNPFYKVLAKPQQKANFDRYLPAETLSFSVSKPVNLNALYDFILDSIAMAGAEGEKVLAVWSEIQNKQQFDFRKDVIGWISGEFASVTMKDGAWVFLARVEDEGLAREKVNQAMKFLSEGLAEAAQQNPMLAMLAIRTSPVQNDRLEGFHYMFMGMNPQPILWGVTDGQLILASSAEAIITCLDTAKGQHPGLRDNARIMKEAIIPDKAFISVSLTDQRNLGQELAAVIGAVSMMSGMMSMAIPDPEVRPVIGKIAGMLGKLTPVVTKIDFYKSIASCSTFDGQAWHTRMVTHYLSPEERAEKNKPEPPVAPQTESVPQT